MSNVIRFLEEMGRDGQVPPESFGARVRATGASLECQSALLERDAARLGALMGGRAHMRCAIMTTEGE